MDKTNALNHFIQTRDKLRTIVNEIPPRKMSDCKLEDSWTAKDILGHITAWDITLLNPLKELALNGSFVPEDIPDHDLYNHQQAEIRHDRDLASVIEEMEQVRQEIHKTCDHLSEDFFARTYLAPWGGEDTLTGMINGLSWHEGEHLKSILKLKATIAE